MAFQAMVTGKITVPPKVKTSKNGNEYVFMLMSCPTHQEHMSTSIFAFDDDIKNQILALEKNDEVALSGNATISEWDDKGKLRFTLTLTPSQVMTMYKYKKKTKHVQSSVNKKNDDNLTFDDDIDDAF